MRSVSQEGGKKGEDTVKESSHLHYPATLLVTQRITFTQHCALSAVIFHKSLTTEWNINKAVSPQRLSASVSGEQILSCHSCKWGH